MAMNHNFAQNAFLIYTGFSASNGGHFPVYSTTFLPFFERKFGQFQVPDDSSLKLYSSPLMVDVV